MKVKIGPYTNWVGPYQIAEKMLFWMDKHEDDRVHNFGLWLAGGDEQDSWLSKFCSWVDKKKKRRVKIQIDRYDTWNMNSTLAMIILPMLRQLKDTKHGSPYVEDEDGMPAELCSKVYDEFDSQTSLDFGADPEYQNASWAMIHRRWEWVLDEMIWAFEQLQPDNDWEAQYWITQPEIDLKTYPEDEGKTTVPLRWKVEGECDWVAYHKHQERITRGLNFFGKYYSGLWD